MKTSASAVAAAEERRKREAQDMLALEIAKGDNENVTLTVRAAIERGYQESFVESLREALKKKENEIDRICARNYSEFLTSTADMLRMRGAATDLTEVVQNIHEDFNKSGEDMVGVLTRLEELQSERSRTRAVFDSVVNCKELSKLMLQTKTYIDAGDHYAAMQVLEVILHGFRSPGAGPGASMPTREVPKCIHSILDKWLSGTITALTETALSSADTLLARLRDKSQLVGRVVLKRQALSTLAANRSSLGSDSADAAPADLLGADVRGKNLVSNRNGSSAGNATFTGSSADSSASAASTAYAALYAERYAQLTLLHKSPSFSLQHIKRCAAPLRLSMWMEPADLKGWLSPRYQWGRAQQKDKRAKKDGKEGGSSRNLTATSTAQTGGDSEEKRGFDYLHKVTDNEERWLDELVENLGPLHKALHLAAVLQRLPLLHTHLLQKRGPALNEILDSSDTVLRTCALTDPGGLVDYVGNLAGFFTVECMLCRSVEARDGAFAWNELLDLWAGACIRLDILVARQTDSLRTPEQVLMVKDEVSLLAEVCNDEALGLPTGPLYETIRLLWNRFEELQVGAIRETVITASTSHLAYQSMYVVDDKTLATKILAFSLESVSLEDKPVSSRERFSSEDAGPTPENSPDARILKQNRRASALRQNLDDLEDDIFGEHDGSDSARQSFSTDASASLPSTGDHAAGGGAVTDASDADSGAGRGEAKVPSLPASFAFSDLVPQVQRSLYLLVTRIVAFAAKNPLLGNMGEATCHSVVKAYDAIVATISAELTREGSDTPIVKAAQVSTDAATMAFASKYCFQLLLQSLHTLGWSQRVGDAIRSAEQQARSMLIRVSLEAQDVVFEILRVNMMQLLESVVFIDTDPSSPYGANEPHEVVLDIIQFLQAKMGVLVNLPQAARIIAYFTACNSIAHALLMFALSDNVKSINVYFIASMEQNCRALTRYAVGTEISALQMCFSELHETVQAVLHRDLPRLSTDPGLMHRLFPKLDPNKLAIFLDKLQPVTGLPTASPLPSYDTSVTKSMASNLRKRINTAADRSSTSSRVSVKPR